jgi:PAS domain S-box-containing protein
MDALRNLVAEMQEDESNRLSERREEAEQIYRHSLWTTFLGAMFGIVAIGAFLWLLSRHLTAVMRAAAAVHEHRQRLQATLASIGDGVIATDSSGRVTFLNPVAEKLTGWSNAEAAGAALDQVFQVISGDSRQAVGNPALRALSEGTVVDLSDHALMIARDGSECPIDDSAAPIRSLSGEIVGAILVFREIRERKLREIELRQHAAELAEANRRKDELVAALRQSEERFRLAAEAVNGIIYDTDLATGHVERTRGLFEVLGYQPDEVPPTTDWWNSLIHPEDRPRFEEETERIHARGGRFIRQYQVRHKDGRYIHVIDRSLALRDDEGRIVRLVGCTQDVTEIKEFERALQDADRRKDEFLATLAHELRNPLAPLANALQVWPCLENDPPQMENLRAMMERQVQQMKRLIDDLLDVSRITRGKIELQMQRISVGTLVSGAIESVQPFLDSCGHRLTLSLPAQPLFVEGDVARLAQVFGNVLHNAAKYTPAGGIIRVAVEKSAEQAVVRIRDNGAGIPPHMLTQIFDMFRQVDETLERSHGGLGIGLTLVKRLVELHGGMVEAHSEGAGKGSEFILRFPLVEAGLPAEDRPKGPPNRRPSRLPSHRILVVDDVDASATTLAMMLRSIGQDVSTVNDGPSALLRVLANPPDVVFLDIAMPGMNGYDVARRIRERLGPDSLCLIALTGYGQEEDRRRALHAGFNHHMTKPATIDELRDVLAVRRPSRAPAAEDRGAESAVS